MRLFIGIPVEGELHEQLVRLLGDLRQRFPFCRWVKPQNLHLTLRFLGDVPEERLAEVSDWLKAKLDGATFGPLQLDKPGWFDQRGRVVLWLSFRDDAWMRELAARLKEAVVDIAPEKRDFVLHLTLARWNSELHQRTLKDDLLEYYGRVPLSGARQARARAVLFQSELQSTGSIYTELLSIRGKKQTTST